MDTLSLRTESELCLPLKPVLAVLAGFGIILLLLSDALPGSPDEVPALLLVGVFFSSWVIAWILSAVHPILGKWFTVLAMAAVAGMDFFWNGTTHSLVFIVVSPVLATALIGIRAGLLTAVCETILFFVGARLAGWPVGLSHVTVLSSLWAVIALEVAIHRLVHERDQWIEHYFERAQLNLQESRQRKLELGQVAENLTLSNRQLALATERMAVLRRVAEDAQKAKAAFVANVSHEFRTPLNMIIGLVELIVDSPGLYAVTLSPRMREDLWVVRRNCEHLSSLVDDVLDLTRVEAGRLVLHRERIKLAEIVDRAVSVVRPLLEKKGLELVVDLPETLPEVYCDRTRIRQVVLNLVSNAVRFTDAGTITIRATERDSQIEMSVTDTGLGILDEDAERVFEPFRQGTDQLWRGKGGSGLGLSISREFVKMHGGRMWLESKLRVGSTFHFTLPVSSPIEHNFSPGHRIRADWVWREESFKSARLGGADDLTKPRIVVCDETGALSSELARYSDEVELVCAQDVGRMKDVVGECPADAIIINTTSPADLWALAQRACEQVAQTPVIVCSVPHSMQTAKDAGALGHLVKPVSRQDMNRALAATGKPVKRVLLVDDDPDVVSLFTRMLSVCDSNLEVMSSLSGQQALECLRTYDFDLVLLDIVMADISGWQVLEAMHGDEGIKPVPTFFVSAQDPADQPLKSKFLLIATDDGLTLGETLLCALQMTSPLLKPETALDPALG